MYKPLHVQIIYLKYIGIMINLNKTRKPVSSL